MIVLIDNGHGVETPGKRSPDGSLREYRYCRETAADVVGQLRTHGIDARLLVPEDEDVKLSVRARRANSFCNRYGKQNVLLVSIHNNAAGNGSRWMSARGWEAWTSPGETPSDRLAACLYDAAERLLPSGTLMRGRPGKEAPFAILTRTVCPAVLTENLFQDNAADVAYLLSTEGRAAIARLHTEGILAFLSS